MAEMRGRVFLRATDPGWARAWGALRVAMALADVEEECPCCGELWQYMGSSRGRHEFRHRHRPGPGTRANYSVAVLPGDFAEEVRAGNGPQEDLR